MVPLNDDNGHLAHPARGGDARATGEGIAPARFYRLLRGIVMILMALDHTRDYSATRRSIPTNLATTTVGLFLTRWITHFCAPTFSLLTGVGAFLMLRRKTKREVSWFLLTRGVWLIVLEATLMRFLWQFNADYHVTFLIVLWALGWSMIVLSVLVFLPTTVIATISIATIALHNLFDGMAAPASSAGRLAVVHSPPARPALRSRRDDVVPRLSARSVDRDHVARVRDRRRVQVARRAPARVSDARGTRVRRRLRRSEIPQCLRRSVPVVDAEDVQPSRFSHL